MVERRNKERGILPIPDLDTTIAPPCNEPSLAVQVRLAAHQTSTRDRGRPAHRIDTGSVRLENLTRPIALLKLQNADFTVTGGACEKTPRLMWGPADDIDGSAMDMKIGDFGPLRILLAPDDNLAIVGGGG